MDRAAIERIDSFPYRHRVEDLLRQLVEVAPDASLEQAAQRMHAAQVGSLVVLDGDGRPVGIVTERDLLSAVAAEGAAALSRTVGAAMSRPVATVPDDAFLHVAIGRLQRLGIRHLVATNAHGRAVGVVSARALLGLRTGRALALGDEIAVAQSPEELAAAHAALPGLSRGLRAEGVTAAQVAAVLAATLRDLAAQAGVLAERELAPPPGPYALLVLGSGGRGESLLAADQDNALICEGGDDAWFAAFGQRVADILDTAGVPYCKGGVMAARPLGVIPLPIGGPRSRDGWTGPRARRCSRSISSSTSRWRAATPKPLRRCVARRCALPSARRCSSAFWHNRSRRPVPPWGRSAAGAARTAASI